MNYTQEITLDLNSNTAYTTIGAKQGDSYTRKVIANLTENGATYNIPPEASAYFRFKKPDGTAIVNKADIENNQVVITLTAQTLAVAGRGYADITLWQGTEILSTVSFIIIVMSAPGVVDNIASSNEFGLLNAIVGDATDIIYEAEAWATGTRGGTPVVSEASFSSSFNSPEGIIQEISVIQASFMEQVGNEPGTQRTFVFKYTTNNDWILQCTTIDGITQSISESELVSNVASYGIAYTTYGGVNPNPDDTITVVVKEKDLAYQNNSKYYAEAAASARQAIEDLTTSGISINASEFEDDQIYLEGDYVWYEDKLYKFITNHAQGPWDPTEVTDDALVDKSISDEHVVGFNFKLPRGRTGDVYYMTFEVEPEDGCLYMFKPVQMTNQVNFDIGPDGNLRLLLGTPT